MSGERSDALPSRSEVSGRESPREALPPSGHRSGGRFPRRPVMELTDLGERSVFITGRRIGRVRRHRLHWLDEEGRVLGEVREAVAPPVPVISGLSDAELVTMRTNPAPRALAAIALIRALLRSGSALTPEISEID